MTFQLTIPAPAEWINANHRLHWAEKNRRTQAWRNVAGLVAASTDAPFSHRQPLYVTPVHIVCTVHKTRGGRWDATNLAPTGKAIVDGLVDAGVIPDDSNEWVTGPDMRAGEKRAEACVVITITEANA